MNNYTNIISIDLATVNSGVVINDGKNLFWEHLKANKDKSMCQLLHSVIARFGVHRGDVLVLISPPTSYAQHSYKLHQIYGFWVGELDIMAFISGSKITIKTISTQKTNKYFNLTALPYVEKKKKALEITNEFITVKSHDVADAFLLMKYFFEVELKQPFPAGLNCSYND